MIHFLFACWNVDDFVAAGAYDFNRDQQVLPMNPQTVQYQLLRVFVGVITLTGPVVAPIDRAASDPLVPELHAEQR
jgi:hypothetical protein